MSARNGFKETEIGWIPEEWEVRTLGDCCAQRRELVEPTTDGGARYVGLEHIDTGNPRIHRWGEAKQVRSTKHKFYKGDLLYGKLRPYLRKAAWAEWEGICSTDILTFVPNDAVAVADFLIYVLHSPDFVAHAVATTDGVNHPRTSWAALRQYTFALPPLPEQRAIAFVLGKIQAAVEAQENIIVTLRELKQATMAKLFREGLRGEPLKETEIGAMLQSWEVVSIGEVTRITSGGTPSRDNPDFWNGDIPWVKTGEINYNLITDTEEKITREGLENSSARLIPAGTLLMAMYGQGVTRGRVAILGIDATINQACAAIFVSERITTEFLFHFCDYDYVRIRSMGHGANQTNLNAAMIKSIQIPLSSLPEQREIAHILSAIDAKITHAEKQRDALQALFKTMLYQLMTGQIRVKDLEVEGS